jgi:microcin C transport system substrate-binding protein
MIRFFAAIVFISSLSFALHAGPANDSAPKGGTFIINLDAEPTLLHPINYSDAYSADVFEWTFEHLLIRHPDTYQLEPGLASSYEISKDGKVFTFVLREGAVWHDGKPVTAEDVKFSFDAIRDNRFKAAPRRSYIENIEKAEVIDPRTIRFTVAKKYFQNFDVCADLLTIVPKHIYSDPNNKKLNKIMVGSGPYKLAQYDKGNKIILEANDKWWGRKEPVLEHLKGRYNFSKIHFKFIGDQNIQLEMLKKGELDYVETGTEGYTKKMVGPEWGKKVFKVKAENLFPKGYGFIGWNLRKDMFKDKKTRIALAHLYNRQLINEKFLSGMSLLATGPWHQLNDYASKTAKPILYDPKQAAKLLKEAGWEDTDKNGVLEKTVDGKKIEFKFTLMNANADTMKYYTIYKEDAKKAGIEIDLKLVEWNTFLKLADERNFDAVVLGFTSTVDYDPKQLWHSTSDTKDGSNFVGYHNPEVDKLIDQAREEMDKKKRIPLIQTVYEKIAADAPHLFLFNARYQFYGHSPKIQKAKDTLTYEIGVTYWWAKQN